jgi:MFS family permease
MGVAPDGSNERLKTGQAAVWAIRTIFFVMGILNMAWTPRIPEIKRSLGVNNGQFGLILLASTVGATIGAQVFGRWVHSLGTKVMLGYSTVIVPVGVILMALSTHHVFWMCCSLFFMAFGIVGTDVAANTQAVAVEKFVGRRYMVGFHGIWSVGTLVATIFGGVIARYISPEVNMIVVAIVGLILNRIAMKYVLGPADDGHKGDLTSQASIPLFRKKYWILWLLGFGMIGALLPEGSVSDWSGILLKENMGFGKGVNASAFACFALAMIVSRLNGDKFLEKFGAARTVKLGGYVGGLAMGLGIAAGVPLSHSHKPLALVVVDLGFIIAGLGIGPMVPAIMQSAARLPGIAPSVALARISIIGMGAYFIGPTITGGLAQWINLPVALAFPVLTLLFAGWISRVMK